MEIYWEGRHPEPVSPELALVDPVLRETLLSRSRLTGSSRAEPSFDLIGQPLVLPPPPIPASARSGAATGGEQMRRSHVIAWTSVTTSCATAFAIAMLAHSQHPRQTHATPPVGPAVAVVPMYTPSATPVEQRTEAEKRRLAILLRSPMRDPFSRASSSR